jgi:pimeloyl-ACP methyl ester carboxylesterase
MSPAAVSTSNGRPFAAHTIGRREVQRSARCTRSQRGEPSSGTTPAAATTAAASGSQSGAKAPGPSGFGTSCSQAQPSPTTAHRAAQGDFDDVAATLKLFIGPAESDNARLLMSLSIRCSEAWARWDPVATARNSAGAYAAESITTKAALMQAACSQVPSAPVPAADGRAVRSDKPVLLLVGGADPADPPENSIDAPLELPNSVTAVFPAGGHCVERYGCAPRLMTDFIDAGTANGLDVWCAARAPIPAFEIGQ